MRKSVYEKWAEIDEQLVQTNNDFVTDYYLSKNTKTRIYFGTRIMLKTLYLEFDDESLIGIDLISLKGMDISIDKVPIIDKTKKYIIITNIANNNEIFLAFSRSLCDELIDTKTYYEAYCALQNTIKEYKEYFSNPNTKLSLEVEQGICAELLELKNLILKTDERVVYNWEGPNKNKRDFVFNSDALEIKSTKSQIKPSISISNEMQLDNKYPKDINNLYLKVYIFELDQEGIDIVSCAKDVLFLIHNVAIKTAFIASLLKLKVDIDIFRPRYKFKLQDIKIYKITDEFPKIVKDTIHQNIYDVKYKLSLNNLQEFETEEAIKYE